MKFSLQKHTKYQLFWLLFNLLGVALFFTTRTNRAWMNAFTQTVTTPLRRMIGEVTYLVPWSVMEVFYVTGAGLAILWLGHWIGNLCTCDGNRLRRFFQGIATVCNVALTVYLSFCFVWGLNYYTDGFQEKSGVYATGGTLEELAMLTYGFAQMVGETAPNVPRDDTGRFDVSRADIFEQSTTVYDFVENQYPFLEFGDKIPKPMSFSVFMSQMNFTGYYCGYTGESNLNIHSPVAVLPFTIAHELAHQRSIASEQECNFLGVLASTTSGNPVYEYSGYLMGYVYLSNALYARNYDLWYAIRETLPETALLDLADNTDYWAQFEDTTISQMGQKTYDTFLKSYGQADGIQSYGTVVDLLLGYYLA